MFKLQGRIDRFTFEGLKLCHPKVHIALLLGRIDRFTFEGLKPGYRFVSVTLLRGRIDRFTFEGLKPERGVVESRGQNRPDRSVYL